MSPFFRTAIANTTRPLIALALVSTFPLLLFGTFVSPEAQVASRVTARISVASDGSQGNGSSGHAAVSGNGRYIVFGSDASNLVPGDTNAIADVFVRDRQTNTTTRVNVSSTGEQALLMGSGDFNITADGRFVSFATGASNLVPDDTNGVNDVFVHDMTTRTTSRVSRSSTGEQGNDNSQNSAFSADGRFVAFNSWASNLVAGDSNGVIDAFIHDRQTGDTTRISVSNAGEEGNGHSFGWSLSANGRFVAMVSAASNLVPGDTNGNYDIFVHDRQTATVTRVSVSSTGEQVNDTVGNPHISADGRYVVFASPASNLVMGDTNNSWDVFVHDRQTGKTERLSTSNAHEEGNANSSTPVISGNGRYVAFLSVASNLIPNDTNTTWDVFVRDRTTNTVARVNISSSGTQANGESFIAAISNDGRFVAFDSLASNLVAGDTNAMTDVFVHDRGTPCQGAFATIFGTALDDTLVGTNGPDVITGLAGNDQIDSLEGNDLLCGGSGSDMLYGGLGADKLSGGAGNDTIYGGGGPDTLTGGGGNDVLIGEDGNDKLLGGGGDDDMDGGADTDSCDGGRHLSGDRAVNCEKVIRVP